MQMSNVILPQKEDIDLDAFPMTLIIYLYVNNKTRKDKQFYYFHMACKSRHFLLKYNVYLFLPGCPK